MASDKLEGNTLSIYTYIVRSDEPVGLRAITREVGLSSSSVTYHHLQKLENLDLIEKNSYGQYSLKKKTSVEGYTWIGKNLIPRLMFYSFFFMGTSTIAVSFILFNLIINSLLIETRFLFLTAINLMSMFLFLVEGLTLYRKLNPQYAYKKQKTFQRDA